MTGEIGRACRPVGLVEDGRPLSRVDDGHSVIIAEYDLADRGQAKRRIRPAVVTRSAYDRIDADHVTTTPYGAAAHEASRRSGAPQSR